MPIKSFEITNYKCFKDRQVFPKPKLVNLIIGKNNSGKTSFLNVFEYIYSNHAIDYDFKIGPVMHYVLDDNDVKHITVTNKYGYYLDGRPAKENPGKCQGIDILTSITRKNNVVTISPRIGDAFNDVFPPDRYTVVSTLDKVIRDSVNSCEIVKVAAERDVTSEPKNYEVKVDKNGKNFTSVLEKIKNHKKSNRQILDNILESLNTILEGENHFESIDIFDDGNGNNTIHLGERYNEIPITEMGSGLKTLLLVLYHLEIAKEEKKPTIFMFEELENNLHPEIQRRLFNLIYDFAIENNVMTFITTHSNVAINCIYGKPETLLYHIVKVSNNDSKIDTITEKDGTYNLLNDLGVKASDILQSNGIIWVEGPSDRVYIKRWLEIVDSSIEENKNYTFLYYGGKILSHFSAEENEGLINILLTNRNSAIVMDSDIKSEDKATKKRIKEEFTNKNMFYWITEGREIENYISKKVINKKYGDNKFEQIGKYQDFKDYIKEVDDDFDSSKVSFARGLSFESEDELGIMDLLEKLKSLADTI